MFDHDDTLVATIEAKWAQHKHVARTWYGKALSDDELREHWGKPLGALMGVLYGTDDIETARRHEQSCHMEYPKALQPGSLAVLHRLHRAGLSIGVVTATSRFSFDHDGESLGIPGSLFSYLQTEKDTDCHKPDPRVFGPLQSWLELRGIRPREVLYVGDGLHDMAAAAGAGVNFAGVATGLVTLDQFQDAGGAAIRTLSELFPSPGQWRWEAACSQAL